MAVKTDISFFRGEDVTIQVTVTGENITSWSLAFALARGHGSDSVITKVTGGTGITITDGANGIFEITLDDGDTDALETGGYVWDVKRTDGGQEAVVAYGALNLKPNVAA